ncbi:MAG: hypothetical protein LIO99_13495 [Clostridiales bacterium]|nr:hypothetical protein [Clostridiales bacterium]
MLGGQRIHVDTGMFQNDMTSINSWDDVLTLLIHLGYLAYDEVNEDVYIPNLEVVDAFKTAVKDTMSGREKYLYQRIYLWTKTTKIT